MSDIYETATAFAKRTGLPHTLIRAMVKQGQLPHIKPRKSHVYINVTVAEQIIRQMSEQTATAIAATMPVPIWKMSKPEPREKKHKGRLPDKVRLAKKQGALT